MLQLFTVENGKYYTCKLTEDGMGIIKTSYEVTITERKEKDLDDLFFDYLQFSQNYPNFFEENELQSLKDAGYDLNINNYASIKCPYLLFVHFLYLPEFWII